MVQLYDQFDRPIAAHKMPERRPLAAAPILDSAREYVTSGLTPQRLAAMLTEADGGDVRRQAELFEQMEEKDAHLLGERGKRVNAILDVEFKVEPASEDSRDQQVAEFVEETISAITDWPDTLTGLQDGVGKGFSTIELHWDVSEGQAVPQHLSYLEQKRFSFTDAKGYVRKYPLLLTDDETMGIEIPPWKVLFHRYGGLSGHATRSGIYRVCAWMYLFKNYALKDWITFCEVYGMPQRLGKYDPGASEDDKDALITAIASLGTDAAGIISRSTEIEFVEAAKGSISADLYENLVRFTNGEISKAILGQTLTAEVGKTGSYAASKTHNEVRLDILKSDGRADAATIRDQMIRPLVGFNFGWDTPVPKYTAEIEEEEDLAAKAEWVGELLDRNVTMPLSFVRREFKIPDPEEGEDVVGGQTEEENPAVAKIIAKMALIAAKSGPKGKTQATDRIIERTAKESDLEAFFEPVTAALSEARDLNDFRGRLVSAYSHLDDTSLGEVIAQGLALAELAGRFDVENQR